MSIFEFSFKHSLKPNLRILVIPVLMAIIIIFLGVFVVKNGMERITNKLEELDNFEATVITLQEKVNILREIEGIVLNQADITVVTIPDKNPTLIMLSQIETQASEKTVDILNKTTQSQMSGSEGLISARVNLNLTGDLTNILDFLLNLDDLAPISTIDEVDLANSGDLAASNLTMSVFWGDFPTRIPPITEPIKTLTAQEENLVNQLAKLKRPELIELKPEAPTIRENPFR
jgi:Tfp pilus assembly protein PilO